jgi:hypothetical protein
MQGCTGGVHSRRSAVAYWQRPVAMAQGIKMDQDRDVPYEVGLHLFEGATGGGIRVAVIDSGVNPHHPHVNGVAGGTTIGPGSEVNEYLDYLGHGTAVVAAIKEKAPMAAYYAVKIYHDSLRTDVRFLCEALEWAIDQRMDVVNLSLGTLNSAHRPLIAGLVKIASEAGVLLVAAAEADLVPVLPGSLPTVIGVGLDWDCPRDVFRYCSAAQSTRWRASGYPRSLPGMHPQRNLHGVSFATANMCGFVVRACELATDRSFSAITEMLRAEALRFALETREAR